MIKVKFNDSSEYREVSFLTSGSHIITLLGDVPENTSGFRTYRMNGDFLGDLSGYTTVYQVFDGGISFSDDGSMWHEEPYGPEPIDGTPTLEERVTDLEIAICEIVDSL